MIVQKKCSHCQRREKEPLEDSSYHMINLVAMNEKDESYTCRFELCNHCMSNFVLIFSDFSNDESIFDLMK